MGLRQTKSVTENGVTTNTRHLWDGAHIIGDIISDPNAPTDPTMNFTATFNRGLGGELISTTQRGQTYNFLHSGLGDIIGLVDRNGNKVANYIFDAFGNQLQTTESHVHNPFRYRGSGYFDSHTGFIYQRFRFLDTTLGRFINEDPARWGLNWYCYAMQNPISFVDFWGLWPEDADLRTVNVTQGSTLAVRAGPGTNYGYFGGSTNRLQRGEQVNINYVRADDRPVCDDGFRWINLATGGWVADRFLDSRAPLFIFHGSEPYIASHIDRNMPELERMFVVVRHQVSTNAEFTRAWNAAPRRMVNVAIMAHGSPNAVSFANSEQLSNLNVKSISVLLLLSCNNAHQNVSNNFAEQMFARNTIGQMVAWDGTLGIHGAPRTSGTTGIGDPVRGWFTNSLPTGTTRDPFGMIHFVGNSRHHIGTDFTSIGALFRRLGHN